MPRCLLVFEPPDGGVAEHVAQLAERLAELGWEVDVAGPASSPVYPRLVATALRVTRLQLGRSLRPVPYARSLVALRSRIRTGRYDVVHVHSSKAGVLVRLGAWRSGVPVVYTPHCFAFIGPQSRVRREVATIAERLLARLTAVTICVAEDERKQALGAGIGPPERLVTILNGVPPPPDPLPAVDRELERWRGEGPLVACLTVLRRQKGVDVFLMAARRVIADAPDVRLAVVGNGPEAGALARRCAELGLDDQVRFFDFQAPAYRQLASLDVFVLPSRWEAFPISILEALAAGVPQVATAVGGTGEAVVDGQTGLLCPPDDADLLAAAIVRLAGSATLRSQMGAASRARYAQRFTVERMVLETAAVYDRVAGRL